MGDKNSIDGRMRQLEDARPTPTEQQRVMQEDRCIVLLARHDALDLAPMLGLDA
jgi:hypothetical protein